MSDQRSGVKYVYVLVMAANVALAVCDEYNIATCMWTTLLTTRSNKQHLWGKIPLLFTDQSFPRWPSVHEH